MADEKAEAGSVWGPLWVVLIILAILTFIGWSRGVFKSGHIPKGIFLAPPPPLGTGQAYGPEIGSSTPQSSPAPTSAYPTYPTDTQYPTYPTYPTQ